MTAARQFYQEKQPISIHIPRVGDDVSAASMLSTHRISIHIPRVGDDFWQAAETARRSEISIHIPRVGDDCGRCR